jgi:hypothetical protein
MAEQTLNNPVGLNSLPWSTAKVVEEYLYDPVVTATTVLTNGMVVILSGGWTSAGDQTSVTGTNIPVIRKATTTPAFTDTGIVINNPTSTAGVVGYVPGQVVQIVRSGITQVLCDANNTTFGHLLVAGSTTAGAATDSASVVAGKTIGACLQTATISSGTALIYCMVRMI